MLVGVLKFIVWYRMLLCIWMCWYLVELIRFYYGSLWLSVRFIFYIVGSLKFLLMVLIELVLLLVGIGWFSGFGLNGVVVGLNEVYESRVMLLFWNGLVIYIVGGEVWNRFMLLCSWVLYFELNE